MHMYSWGSVEDRIERSRKIINKIERRFVGFVSNATGVQDANGGHRIHGDAATRWGVLSSTLKLSYLCGGEGGRMCIYDAGGRAERSYGELDTA